MKKNTFDRLNLLRIFAFLMIFLLHAKIFIPVAWYENVEFAWILFTPAWAGVWIFFILSGYGIGHGFYKNIYQLSLKGILKYYYRRLIKIVPIYWAYLFLVTVFLKPEYLLPGKSTVSRLLSLFLFSYQEEFDSIYYGLAWYLSTLIRLYLIAPIIYFLIKRYLTGKKYFLPLLIALFFFGILFRISMGYHITITESGNWASDIYKPFYFNLDLYFGGFILNELKSRQFKIKPLKIIPWLFFGGLVLYNSHIYYFSSYFGTGNLNIYCYVLPSIYLLVVCWLIFNYDILRNYSDTPLSLIELKKNKWRIIDCFAKLQMPLYLFHSTILLLMQNGYSESWYIKIVSMLHIPEKYQNFTIGCIFTGLSLIYSIFFAGFIHLCCEKTLFQFCDSCFKWFYSKIKSIINKVRYSDILQSFTVKTGSRKLVIFLFVIVQTGILLYFLLSKHLVFATNDDTLKVAMAGGGFGVPSEYLGYNTIHILLGYLFKGLFTAMPYINWITVYYLITIFTAFICLQIMVGKINSTGYYFNTIIGILLNIFFFLFLEYFTFTLVAYSMAITGGVAFFLVICDDNKKIWNKKGYLITGTACVIISCLVRPAVVQSVIVVLGIYSTWQLICKRRKAGLVICILIFIIMKSATVSNEVLVARSQVQKEYYEWSAVRINALDAKLSSWEKNHDILEENGLNKDIYDIIYSARYVDRDIVSIDNLNLLNQLNISGLTKYNWNLYDYAKAWFGYIGEFAYIHSVYKILFWVAYLFAIYYLRNSEILVLGLTALITEALFVFMDRNLYRVAMPTYVFVIILIIIRCSQSALKRRSIQRQVLGITSFIATACLSFMVIYGEAVKWKEYNYSFMENSIEVLEYMEEHQDKLFFPVNSGLYALEIYRPVFRFAGENGICFFYGDGAVYSETFYQAMNHYDISDPDRAILEAADNNDIYFIGNCNAEEVNYQYQSILNYVRNKGDTEVELVLFERIGEEFAVYLMKTI